jgi:hypothetical protein
MECGAPDLAVHGQWTSLREHQLSPARVRAIADEFPKAFFFLEFATGILNCGMGMMIDLEPISQGCWCD